MAERPFVRVDPAMRFGAPNVKGISAEVLAGSVMAGDSIETCVEEYGLTRADMLVTCWFQGMFGTRRWRRAWGEWAREAGQAMWDADRCDYDAIPDPPVSPPDRTADLPSTRSS